MHRIAAIALLAIALHGADQPGLEPRQIVVANHARFPIQIAVGGVLQGVVPAGEVRTCAQEGAPVAGADASWTRRGGWAAPTGAALSAVALLPDGTPLTASLTAVPADDGRTVVWIGAGDDAGAAPTPEQVATAAPMSWATVAPMEAAVAPRAPADVTSDAALAAAIAEFYDDKSEWAGVYRLVGIVSIRLAPPAAAAPSERTAYVAYRYEGLKRVDLGVDRRTFTIVGEGAERKVTAMGGHMSALGDGLRLLIESAPSASDATERIQQDRTRRKDEMAQQQRDQQQRDDQQQRQQESQKF